MKHPPTPQAIETSSLLNLPEELTMEALQFLSSRDLRTFEVTCKKFKRMARRDDLWVNVCWRQHALAVKPAGWTWKSTAKHASQATCKHLVEVLFGEERSKTIDKLNIGDVIESKQARNLKDAFRKVFTNEKAVCDGDGSPGGACRLGFPDLWMCCHCYKLGCGRNQRRHALNHYHQTGNHFVTLKIKSMDFWCYGCDHWLGQRDLVEKTFAEDFAQCLPNSQEEKNAWRCVDVWRARRREERTWANSAARPLETYYVLEPGWGDSWIQFLVGNGGPPGRIDNAGMLTTTSESPLWFLRWRFHSETLQFREGIILENLHLVDETLWSRLSGRYGANATIHKNMLPEEVATQLDEIEQWRYRMHHPSDDEEENGMED
eukprot:g7018.t1